MFHVLELSSAIWNRTKSAAHRPLEPALNRPVGPRRWKGDLHEGEPVEYVGSQGDEWVSRGDQGTLVDPGELGDPPPSWVVSFENTTGVFPSADLRPVTLPFSLRMADGSDRQAVEDFLKERSTALVARLGELVDALEQPALVAEENARLVGVLTYILDGESCEVLTLHVSEKGSASDQHC